MKVGDILYANVGWSAGIPMWYQVTRVSAKSVWYRTLKRRVISDDGYGQNGTMMPAIGQFDERRAEQMSRLKHGSYGEYIRIDNYSCAYLWDGNEKQFYTD